GEARAAPHGAPPTRGPPAASRPPPLTSPGLYFVENVHAGYWPEVVHGLEHELSDLWCQCYPHGVGSWRLTPCELATGSARRASELLPAGAGALSPLR